MITGLSCQVLQITTDVDLGGSQSNNGNPSFSRLSKVDFPRFDGEDVQGWIYKCEQSFELENTADTVKVKLASIQLSGKALAWHQSFMKSRNRVWPSWKEHKEAITIRFGTQPFDDPLAELMKLRRHGSIEHYQESFDALLNRVELPMGHAMSYFLSGLCDEIENAVRMFRPQTIHDAYCLAKLQEATLASISRRTKPILERPPSLSRSMANSFRNPPLSTHKFVPREYSSFTASKLYSMQPASSAHSVTSKPRNPERILSAKDIEEKRARNMCFFYDEKYFPAHKCKVQVYQLEI